MKVFNEIKIDRNEKLYMYIEIPNRLMSERLNVVMKGPTMYRGLPIDVCKKVLDLNQYVDAVLKDLHTEYRAATLRYQVDWFIENLDTIIEDESSVYSCEYNPTIHISELSAIGPEEYNDTIYYIIFNDSPIWDTLVSTDLYNVDAYNIFTEIIDLKLGSDEGTEIPLVSNEVIKKLFLKQIHG